VAALTRISPALGLGAHPRGDVHAAAGIVLVAARRLVEMDTDPDVGREALRAPVGDQLTLDGLAALERRVNAVEGDEEAIAGVAYLLARMGGELGPQRVVVPAQEVRPGLITEGLYERGRTDDVGEHERSLDALVAAGA